MTCPNCGQTSRIREKDKYCHFCGCNLKTEEVTKETKQTVEIEVDETIKTVCKKIRNDEIALEDRAETLKALALLVKARASLI